MPIYSLPRTIFSLGQQGSVHPRLTPHFTILPILNPLPTWTLLDHAWASGVMEDAALYCICCNSYISASWPASSHQRDSLYTLFWFPPHRRRLFHQVLSFLLLHFSDSTFHSICFFFPALYRYLPSGTLAVPFSRS